MSISKHCSELKYPRIAKIPENHVIWFYQILDKDKIKECANLTYDNIIFYIDTLKNYHKNENFESWIYYIIDYLEYISSSSIILNSEGNEKSFVWNHGKGLNYSTVWSIAIKKVFNNTGIDLKIKIDNDITFTFVLKE